MNAREDAGKMLPGIIVGQKGHFFTVDIQDEQGVHVVTHYANLRFEKEGYDPSSDKLWLRGKKIVVVYGHEWKGLEGIVKEVIPGGNALVELSSHTMYFGNPLQKIPLNNLALDFRESQ